MPGTGTGAAVGNGSFTSNGAPSYYPYTSPRLGSNSNGNNTGVPIGSGSASQNGHTPPPQADDQDELDATMTDVHFDAEQLIVENERLKTRCSVLKRRVEALEKAAAASAVSSSRQLQLTETAQMTEEADASAADDARMTLARVETEELENRVRLLTSGSYETESVATYAAYMEAKVEAAAKAKDLVIAHLISRVQSLTKELEAEKEGRRRAEEELQKSHLIDQTTSHTSPVFRMRLQTSTERKSTSPESDSDSEASDHERQTGEHRRSAQKTAPGTDRGHALPPVAPHAVPKREPQTARPSGASGTGVLGGDPKSPSPSAPSGSQARLGSVGSPPFALNASPSIDRSDFKFVHHITLKKQTVSRTARGSEGSPSPAPSGRSLHLQGQTATTESDEGVDDQEELILVTPRYSTRFVGHTDPSPKNFSTANAGVPPSRRCLNS